MDVDDMDFYAGMVWGEDDEDCYADDWQDDEKYYWHTAEDKYIPVDELTDKHIINIVFKFGKDKLEKIGYHRIVEKFNNIRIQKQF